MQVTRKIAAAAAVATVATLGLATVVSANMLDDTQKKAQDTGLADTASLASKGGYGGKQAGTASGRRPPAGHRRQQRRSVPGLPHCSARAPASAATCPVNDITGVVGFFNDGNSVTAVKTCEQDNAQANRQVVQDGRRRRGVGEPQQRRPVPGLPQRGPATGIGGNVPLTNLAGVLGAVNDGNSVDTLKTCEQDSEQNN